MYKCTITENCNIKLKLLLKNHQFQSETSVFEETRLRRNILISKLEFLIDSLHTNTIFKKN